LGEWLAALANAPDAARLPFAGAALLPEERDVAALARVARDLDVRSVPFRNGGLPVHLALFRRR
jgi:hypothetical protein